MDRLLQVPVDEKDLQRAESVTAKLGTTTQALVRVFVAKIAATGKVPMEIGLQDDTVTAPWEQRAEALENFYDPIKAW